MYLKSLYKTPYTDNSPLETGKPQFHHYKGIMGLFLATTPPSPVLKHPPPCPPTLRYPRFQKVPGRPRLNQGVRPSLPSVSTLLSVFIRRHMPQGMCRKTWLKCRSVFKMGRGKMTSEIHRLQTTGHGNELGDDPSRHYSEARSLSRGPDDAGRKEWHDAKVFRGLYGVENIGSNDRKERTAIRVSNVP